MILYLSSWSSPSLWWHRGISWSHITVRRNHWRTAAKSVAQTGRTTKIYEVEPVNRSQMDIKRKTCDIRTWKKHLFLDISFTNNVILVSSLYQCMETSRIDVCWLLPQPHSHLRFNLFVISETFATQLWNALRDKHLDLLALRLQSPSNYNAIADSHICWSPVDTRKDSSSALVVS
jgi:hypothetical protein